MFPLQNVKSRCSYLRGTAQPSVLLTRTLVSRPRVVPPACSVTTRAWCAVVPTTTNVLAAPPDAILQAAGTCLPLTLVPMMQAGTWYFWMFIAFSLNLAVLLVVVCYLALGWMKQCTKKHEYRVVNPETGAVRMSKVHFVSDSSGSEGENNQLQCHNFTISRLSTSSIQKLFNRSSNRNFKG